MSLGMRNCGHLHLHHTGWTIHSRLRLHMGSTVHIRPPPGCTGCRRIAGSFATWRMFCDRVQGVDVGRPGMGELKADAERKLRKYALTEHDADVSIHRRRLAMRVGWRAGARHRWDDRLVVIDDGAVGDPGKLNRLDGDGTARPHTRPDPSASVHVTARHASLLGPPIVAVACLQAPRRSHHCVASCASPHIYREP
jgi:hypothetical protein